jgi:hypothetical protein
LSVLVTSVPFPFRFQMASMRRTALSSRHVGFARPRRIQRLAPLMLAPIRTLVGRSLDDPVHDKFRLDAGAAI